jgi:hypothetical protein
MNMFLIVVNIVSFNKQLKKNLVNELRKINVLVPPEAGDREMLDNSITHIISSPNARTMVTNFIPRFNF